MRVNRIPTSGAPKRREIVAQTGQIPHINGYLSGAYNTAKYK